MIRKFKPLMLVVPDNHAPAQAAVRQFADNVARRTQGNLTIASIPISKLVNQPSLVGMVMDGSADMALPVHDRLMGCSGKFGCIGVPFVFDDYAHVDRVLDGGFMEWVAADLEKVGVIAVAAWEWGFRQITNSRRPILQPKDMQGLKIRVPTTPLCRVAILALGSVPVMVEFEQLSRAIRQGLIDGQENPVSVIDSLGLQHHQKYLSMLNYTYGTLVHVVNRQVFESLLPEQRVILCEESAKAGRLMRGLVRAQEKEQIAMFSSEGMQVDRPDPAPFKVLMDPVVQALRQSCGDENIDAFLGMVERRRDATGKVEK